MEYSNSKIKFNEFYNNYYGHTSQNLQSIISSFKNKKNFIYLVGDSSLDNKHWILSKIAKAVNGYERIISPPKSVMDISYHLNSVLIENESNYVCVNCAVEESTIGMREGGNLLEQDVIVRDNITSEDILIVSIGGNDVVLKPKCQTIMKMLWLSKISKTGSIIDGSAWGLGYFINLFKNKIEEYIQNICPIGRRPKKIMVCMIYYPHEKRGGWADTSLKFLNYNSNPSHLKSIISSVYELATKQINIEGSEVIPVKLFEILDSRIESNDYVERVEPSETGGRKMAEAFFDLIKNNK